MTSLQQVTFLHIQVNSVKILNEECFWTGKFKTASQLFRIQHGQEGCSAAQRFSALVCWTGIPSSNQAQHPGEELL